MVFLKISYTLTYLSGTFQLLQSSQLYKGKGKSVVREQMLQEDRGMSEEEQRHGGAEASMGLFVLCRPRRPLNSLKEPTIRTILSMPLQYAAPFHMRFQTHGALRHMGKSLHALFK